MFGQFPKLLNVEHLSDRAASSASDGETLDLGITTLEVPRPGSEASQISDRSGAATPNISEQRVASRPSSRKRGTSKRPKSGQLTISSEDDQVGSRSGSKLDLIMSNMEDFKVQTLVKEQQLERERMLRARKEEELLMANRNLMEKLRRHEIEVELMKGQLKRRNELLDNQRESFYKELLLLREELFKKNGNSNYVPTDFSLFNWTKKNRYEDEMEKDSYSRTEDIIDTEHRTSSIDTASYFALKEQSKKVQDTLTNLKNLEYKRKQELERLQKEREETEKLKKKLAKKAKELRKSAAKDKEAIVKQIDAVVGEVHDPSEDLFASVDEHELSNEVSQETAQKAEEEVPKEETPKQEPEKRAATPKKPLEVLVLSDDEEETQSEEKEEISSVELQQVTPKLFEMDLNRDSSDETRFEDSKVEIVKSNEPPKPEIEIPSFLKQDPVEKKEQEQKELEHLQSEVVDFQSKYNDLKSKMNTVRARLMFYKQDKEQNLKPNAEGPKGDVTLVFTDVQDSTRLWELDMDIMQQSIKVHNDVMRQVLDETEGFEVKTEGDAFMCAFHTTEDAIEFALRAQIRLLEAEWPDHLYDFDPGRIEMDPEDIKNIVYRGLRVRMGVHVGKPIVERDPVTGRYDYFGPVVNRAARVEGQAAGGQIVISNAVWEKIKDKLDTFSTQIWSKYMGVVSLKGMDEAENIRTILPYQLRNRKFPEVKVIINEQTGLKELEEKQEEPSIKQLQNQLRLLKAQHNGLTQMKEAVKGKIQFKIRMQALEKSLMEKDSVIQFLKAKIDNPTGIALEEIDEVMKRYDEIKAEYLEMKQSYDDAYDIFEDDNQLEEMFNEVTEMKHIVPLTTESDSSWSLRKTKYENELEQVQNLIKQRERRILDLKKTLKALQRLRERRYKSPSTKRNGDRRNLSKNRVNATKKKDPNAMDDSNSLKHKHEPLPSTQTPKTEDPIQSKSPIKDNSKPSSASNKKDISSQKMKNLMKAKLNAPNVLSQSLPSSTQHKYQGIRPIISSAASSRNYVPYRQTFGLSRSSAPSMTQQPPPIVPSSIGEITQILKDAIQEAIGSSSDSKDLNWDSFIQGVSKSVVEDIPSTPIKPEQPQDVFKNIIIFDEKTNQYVQIPKEALKKWGVIHAAKFIAEQQFKAGLSKGVRINSREVLLEKPKQRIEKENQPKRSYSRLLESFSRPNIPPTSSFVNVNIIHQWEPLGSPFRKVRVPPSAEERERIMNELKNYSPYASSEYYTTSTTLSSSQRIATGSSSTSNNALYLPRLVSGGEER
ncbi:hypothetical protein C9374_009788 [Naegleria lovaniensis]|uniref:Guanylate cyclase domain-containing protein n=1 Tax=Naegleria lovaniensis TaxID=51637 RepID=A0AA88H3I7_NAELO|nr:uncharacterized protein C9374_009788 [Naegleria lovaniensis]KAG2393211.1 hypothetical protein C9374_009788 [Naegleria lovaniensis]